MALEELGLVRRAMAGDREAAGDLLDRYRGRALCWAAKVVRNTVDAEEVVADVTVKALEKLQELRDPEAFSTWLYRMIFRYSLNSLRDRGTEKEALENLPRGEPKEELPDADLERIREAMKKLPLDLQVVLVMRYWEGLSYAEIAERLKAPEGTVKVRAFRAHQRLKGLLAPP